MVEKKRKNPRYYETVNVRVNKKTRDKVVKRKGETGVSVGAFFTIAAEEKLKRES